MLTHRDEVESNLERLGAAPCTDVHVRHEGGPVIADPRDRLPGADGVADTHRYLLHMRVQHSHAVSATKHENAGPLLTERPRHIRSGIDMNRIHDAVKWR